MDIKIEPELENAEYWEDPLITKTEYGITDIVVKNIECEESVSEPHSNYVPQILLVPQTLIQQILGSVGHNSTNSSPNIHESVKYNWLFCFDCDSSFENHKLFTRHLELPHNFKCNKCTKSYLYIYELENHKKVLKHFDQCTKCNNIYDSQSDLKQHDCKTYDSLTKTKKCDALNVTDEAKSQCHKSSYSCSPILKNILENPLDMTRKLMFMCEKCKKLFEFSTENVIRHNSVTHIECEMCNNVFGWDDLSSNVGYVEMNKIEEFQCNKCSEVFKWDKSRKKQAFMALKIQYQCVICDMLFKCRRTLGTHIAALHKSSFSSIQCQLCNNIFSWPNLESNVSMNIVNNTAEFQCIKCKQVFGWDENKKRAAAMALKPTFHCEKCGKSYKQKSNIYNHICTSTEPDKLNCKKVQIQYHYCPKCKNIFTWDNLESNVSMNDRAEFQCIKCYHVFKWDKSRKMQATLALKPTFLFNEGAKTYQQKSNLDKHIKDNCTSSDSCNLKPQSQCQKCNNIFTWRNLESNISMNDKEEFQCLKCNHVFGWDENRNREAAMALKLKFHCEKCGKSYTRKWNLDNHICTSTKFHCEKCGKSYRQKSNLHNHICTSNKFHCEKCGKSYTRKWNLDNHICTSTKFHCEKCGKSYKQKVNLHNHICTSTKPYELNCKKVQIQCHKCNNIFTWDNIESNISMNDRAEFECIKCNHVFKWDKSRKMQATLALKIRFRCGECNLSFKVKKDLDRHIAVSHVSTYSCKMCNKLFASLCDLNKHKVEKTHFRCNNCNIIFLWDDLEKYVAINFENKFECKKCRKVLKWGRIYKKLAARKLKPCRPNKPEKASSCKGDLSI